MIMTIIVIVIVIVVVIINKSNNKSDSLPRAAEDGQAGAPANPRGRGQPGHRRGGRQAPPAVQHEVGL